MNKSLSCIILAAGNSSRLGQPKQLVSIKGTSLINNACELACRLQSKGFVKEICCVLGYEAKSMDKLIASHSVKVAVNEHWHLGMGSSIKVGLESLTALTSEKEENEGVLVILVDQYLLSEADLKTLVKRWQQDPKKIVCAQQADSFVKGPPVIFPRELFAKILQIPDQVGAKKVIDAHQEQLVTVNIENAFVDLDTPEDLAQLRRLYSP